MVLALVWALAVPSFGVSAATSTAPWPAPDPRWEASDVVRFQLEALRDNGPDEAGIKRCFAFASPENKRLTGPVERFGAMIRRGPYRLMLNFRDATYHPIELRGARALQRVTLAGTTRAVTYIFELSKQTAGPCLGCWMTDSVRIERIEQKVT